MWYNLPQCDTTITKLIQNLQIILSSMVINLNTLHQSLYSMKYFNALTDVDGTTCISSMVFWHLLTLNLPFLFIVLDVLTFYSCCKLSATSYIASFNATLFSSEEWLFVFFLLMKILKRINKKKFDTKIGSDIK